MQRERAQATGSKHVQAWNSAPSLGAHAELMAVLSKPCLNPHEQPYNSVDKPVHPNVNKIMSTCCALKLSAASSKDVISVIAGKDI